MFEGFADVWTPVEIADRVASRRLTRVRLANEPIVLFRSREGRAGALIDRCPHRGVALSRGRLTDEGRVECPFHGWQFEADGACAHVPFNDPASCKRERLGATSLPVREAGGLIWIYTGAPESAAGEPLVPEALDTSRGWFITTYAEPWATHWTRAMENMLDFPHLPFLHRRTIGRGIRAAMTRDSKLDLTWEPTETGAQIRALFDGQPSEASLEWRRPNGMVMGLDRGGRRVRMHVWCVPETDGATRMILAMGRDAKLGLMGKVLNELNRYIFFEDRRVVESSQPPEVPPPGEEVSVATDGPTLAFRKYYYRELRGRGAERLVPADRLALKKSGAPPVAAAPEREAPSSAA